MKTSSRSAKRSAPRSKAGGLVAGACLLGSLPLAAQQTPAAPAASDAKKDTPAKAADASAESAAEYNNWITLGVGSTFIDGDKAAFMRRRQIPKGPFGGIEDFHMEESVGKKGQFQVDGHGIFDNHDYSIRVELADPDKGFVRAGYTEFRTWYDGSGGFFPPNGQWIAPDREELSVDRGRAWFEAGLTLPNAPQVTLRYAHEFREGRKDSTVWGDSNLTGGLGTRAIAPSYLGLDETRDILQLDVKHTLGKVDFGAGIRYDIIANDDSRNIHRRAGEFTPAPGADRYVTQRDKVDEDLWNVHGFAETRFSEKVMLTLGGSFTTLDTDLSGSRIYGGSVDSVYDPLFARRQFHDEGFLDLAGGANMKQYVGNINLMLVPLDNVTLVPAVRIEKMALTGTASFTDTDVGAPPALPAIQEDLFNSADRGFVEVSESLEARYTGLRNWAFYARGEWSQTEGNQTELETDAASGVANLYRDSDWHRLNQKYVAGANWYPLARLNFGAQYYHKIHAYDYDHLTDPTSNLPPSADRYPALLTDQDFTTDDMNFRVTWRPCATVSTVTRYDFQLSTIQTRADFLAGLQSAELTSHIVSESVNWTPLPRLYLQASASYSLDSTDTPAAGATGTNLVVLNAANDYWNVTGLAGYALSEKSDLQAQYFYYRADNYVDNSAFGMPYGAQGEEHGVTASLVHRFSQRVRMTLKYGFFRNRDTTSGGHNDYDAHLVYASMQYRF